MKNNFTQALRELTGFDDENDYKPVEKTKRTSETSDIFNDSIVEVDCLESFDDLECFESANNESTNISSSMIVSGNIKSEDNVYVCGAVFGNIKTSADVRAEHLIKGDIDAENIYLKDAKINGNLSVKNRITAGANVTVIGDIKCGDAQIIGKVKGNCDVKDNINLTSTALVYGDIIADEISTEQGARIIGAITTRTKSTDIESEFNFDFGGAM